MKFRHRIIEKILKINYNSVICDSNVIKDIIIDRGFDKSLITTIYPAIINHNDQIQEKQKKTDIFKILSVARFDKIKGHIFLIEGFKKFIETDNPNAKLILVGDGAERKNIEKIAAEKKILNSIEFAGFITNTEFYYLSSDIFVLPSLSEGTPVVLLESMSFKLPIISSNLPAISEILKNKSEALLIEPASSEAIYLAIKELFYDTEKRSKLSKKAFEKYYLHFSFEKQYLKLKKIYESQ